MYSRTLVYLNRASAGPNKFGGPVTIIGYESVKTLVYGVGCPQEPLLTGNSMC